MGAVAVAVAGATLGSGAWTEPALVGQWFVFGSVGVRLGMAGPRQIPQPRYTAELILSLT